MLNKNFKIFDCDSLKNIHKKVFFSIFIFSICYSLIFFQIFNIMVISRYFDVNVENKKELNKKNKDRGKILDRNGVILASTIKSYSLFANPNKLNNINNISQELSNNLKIPEIKIIKKLNKKTKFVWIKRNITPKEHQSIINLGEVGLQTKPEKKRNYH